MINIANQMRDTVVFSCGLLLLLYHLLIFFSFSLYISLSRLSAPFWSWGGHMMSSAALS